jgi:hypothetical protein
MLGCEGIWACRRGLSRRLAAPAAAQVSRQLLGGQGFCVFRAVSVMGLKIQPLGGTRISRADQRNERYWREWRSQDGPPVPVWIDCGVWNTLVQAAHDTADPVGRPRVFRLFMRRGQPRRVWRTSEIERVRIGRGGVIRWEEGGYPSLKEPLRKGGNCFIRGSAEIGLADAWWMGREQTDLRVLLARRRRGRLLVSAWWSRRDSRNGTDGELWPVRVIIGEASNQAAQPAAGADLAERGGREVG